VSEHGVHTHRAFTVSPITRPGSSGAVFSLSEVFLSHRIHRLAAVAVSGVAALGLVTLAPGSAQASSGGSWDYSVSPIQVKSDIAPSTGADALPTPAQCLASYGLSCNTVDSIRSAYDIPATIGGAPAGTGRTVVIVDAFGSPTAQADLDTFSASMGIPSTDLNVYYPEGKVAWHGTELQNDWAGETSLDVQWAHAVAPGATIDLVVANSPSGNVLNNAVDWAVDNLGADTLSMSYGAAEGYLNGKNGNNTQIAQAQKIFAKAAAKGITVFASSGDSGSDNGFGTENFAYPAADPNVVAVGGTNLLSNTGVAGPAETVWDDDTGCPFDCTQGTFGATGGAPSLSTDKQGSDVAYNASVYTSVLVYEGFNADPDDNGFYFTGGTSSGSPQWAAIAADLDQAAGHDLGGIRGSLAGWLSAGALRDVTVGDNATTTFAGGYAAGAGWDVPTGYGTPDVGRLIDQVS